MNCQNRLYCNENYCNENPKQLARRWFLQGCGVGMGALALAHLAGSRADAAVATTLPDPLAPRAPHFPGKVKNVIFLFMAGAPSQLELFDNKPALSKFDGTLPPADLLKGYKTAFINPNSTLLGPRYKFQRFGQSGTELSEILPNLGAIVDDVAIIKTMHTDAFNHAPAQLLMNTGSMQFGRPSMGSWITYGLGSEAHDLPAFVVFSSGKKGPSGGNACWGSGFLPTVYQGVEFRSSGDPVLYLSNPPGSDAAVQRDSLDALRKLNSLRLDATGDPEISTRINSYEMAFRMQTSAPELMDISKEPKHILDMYGVEPGKPSFAYNCLLARRLAERGVRFTQLFHESWDQHSQLTHDIKENCQDTDKASAALVTDLKQRGMLKDTLVVWGGEFGRTPMVQGSSDGRDHHPNAYSMWMAGGGVKGGVVLGQTDELGFNGVEDRVHVNDLHATMLQLLGFDHTKLTYKFQGRPFRLTDVRGEVVHKILQ